MPSPGAAIYSVVPGDTLWSIAHKFHSSVKALEAANNLTDDKIKPGQTLQIVDAKIQASTEASSDVASEPSPVSHTPTADTEPAESTTYLRAQPVQDCDLEVPASTFASCPTPPPSSDPESATPDAPASQPAPAVAESPAPHAEPVSATEFSAATPAPQETSAATGSPDTASSSSPSSEYPSGNSLSVTKDESSSDNTASTSIDAVAPSGDWAKRFLAEAHDLSNKGIEYDESWQPPGESHSWDMDCSNTSRYIYKVTTGIQLPRTASDQYYYLHLQNKAWDVPQARDGFADCNYLRQNLKPGDLLFWENTYKPERQPPITHVMVFLGTNEKGQWIMVGSQSSHGGLHNRSHGGPDIYVFDPTKPCGGYSTWLGMFHYQGRFCAFGRPLEADRSKLAVAAND